MQILNTEYGPIGKKLSEARELLLERISRRSAELNSMSSENDRLNMIGCERERENLINAYEAVNEALVYTIRTTTFEN